MSNFAAEPIYPGVIDVSIPTVLLLENGYRPQWLLTSYAAPVWKVTEIGHKRQITIRFDMRLPNGRLLTDYDNLLQSIKRIVYGVRTGPLMRIDSGTVQASIAANLITLARWMINNRINRFDELNQLDIREYTELAIYGTHSILNSEGVLNKHLEILFTKAAFCKQEPKAVHQQKAMDTFPYYLTGSKQIRLNRHQILTDAGLDGVSFSGGNNVLSSILDDVEDICGFYQQPAIKARKKCKPTINEVSRALDKELGDEIVSTEHLRRLLISFEVLYLHRGRLDDALQNPPFPSSSASAKAQVLGKSIGRTGTIPVKQAATIIEQSIRWVLDYAPIILELKKLKDTAIEEPSFTDAKFNKLLQRRAWPKQSPGTPFPILTGHWKAEDYISAEETEQALALRDGMTLPVAINFLLVACAIVIAAFSARRAAEIISLQFGCIERDETGKPWLKIYIYKTLQDFTIIPVPEVVASAIAVLEQISARARGLTGTAYLFQFNQPGTTTCQSLSEDGAPIFSLGTHLRKFGFFLDVPVLDDGTRWTFRPHQFRRFFVILYLWIYELGDWQVLSYHLRHFDGRMVERYGRDAVLGHVIAMADPEHTAQILASAVLGKTEVSGIEGERLKQASKRLFDRMSVRIQVVPERKFFQRVLRFVERAGITLQALPWGYCAGSSNASHGTHACAPQDDAPDIGSATVSTCKDCVFNVRTASFLPYLQTTHQMHRAIASSSTVPTILRKASDAFTKELDEYIDSLSPCN